jgi:hypothetical protein
MGNPGSSRRPISTLKGWAKTSLRHQIHCESYRVSVSASEEPATYLASTGPFHAQEGRCGPLTGRHDRLGNRPLTIVTGAVSARRGRYECQGAAPGQGPRGVGAGVVALHHRQVAGDGWQLDARELHLLTAACREADMLAHIEETLVGQPMTARGAQGQMVSHPLLGEARRSRTTIAGLLEQIGLEDPLLDGKDGTGSRTTSWQAREAAQARQRNVQVARRATGGRAGEYLPQITAGVRARAASLSDAFPGIGTSTLDALNQGDLLDWKRPPSGPRCTPSVHPPHSSSRSATAARGPTGSRSRCSATTRAPAPWSTSKREGPPQTQRAAASSTPAHHDVPHRFRR